jgi:hypothetical protein
MTPIPEGLAEILRSFTISRDLLAIYDRPYGEAVLDFIHDLERKHGLRPMGYEIVMITRVPTRSKRAAMLILDCTELVIYVVCTRDHWHSDIDSISGEARKRFRQFENACEQVA